MGFCSLQELRDYIVQTGATTNAGINDVYLEIAIETATANIQHITNRTFETTLATAAARTFTYRPSPGPYGVRGDYYGNIDWAVVYPNLYGLKAPTVEVDDFFLDAQAITDITIVDYLTAATYTPTRGWPYNAAAKDDPFTRLEFASSTSLPTGEGQLIVTAKWGWTAVPDAVKNACLLQASRYYVRRLSPAGVIGFGDMGGGLRVSSRPDPDVASMVDGYTRYWTSAVA